MFDLLNQLGWQRRDLFWPYIAVKRKLLEIPLSEKKYTLLIEWGNVYYIK